MASHLWQVALTVAAIWPTFALAQGSALPDRHLAPPAEAPSTATSSKEIIDETGDTPQWMRGPIDSADAGAVDAAAGEHGDLPEKLSLEGLFARATARSQAAQLANLLPPMLLIVGILIFGFSLIGRGLIPQERCAATWIRNISAALVGVFAFWAYGFAIGFGSWWNGSVPPGYVASLGPGLQLLNGGFGLGPDPASPGAFRYGLLGTKGFFLHGVNDVSVSMLFVFMLQFVVWSMLIACGALARRWPLRVTALSALWGTLVYCIYANWVWGGGWLVQSGLNWGLGHGAVDFLGAGVVHGMGGMIALAGCVAARRRGPQPRAIIADQPQGNVVSLMLGTLVLALLLSGWDFNFPAITNAWLAGLGGVLAVAVAALAQRGRVLAARLCQGLLAGMVGCSASCPFVTALGALVIGALAGVWMLLAMRFWQRRGIEDATGAAAVHGVAGLWGLVAVGLFANGQYGDGWNGVVRDHWRLSPAGDAVRGLFYGDASQLAAQLLAALVVIVVGFGLSYVWFRILIRFSPLPDIAFASSLGE